MSWLTRALNVFRTKSLEGNFDEEIRFHLEQRADRNVADGMQRKEAEDDALRRFGSVERAKAGMLRARVASRAVPALSVLTLVAVVVLARPYWDPYSRVYELGGDVTPPVSLSTPKARYSASATRAKVQGTVRVACVIRTDGVCADIRVIRSLDRAFGLDDEAVRAVRQWRFVPARLKGRAVATNVMFDVTFALR